MDIVFWTLDFSDKFVLPATSKTIGYVSMNAKIEFCGSGSCELEFYCKDLEDFTRAHPEGFFIVWGKFQGYITDWQFKEKKKSLYGSHLNSIIHKAVFPPQNITTRTVAYNVNKLVSANVPWLKVVSSKDASEIVPFCKEKYTNADSFVQEYLEKVGLGYNVYIEDKELCFEIVFPEKNSLMLSENNLNMYELQEDFSNKKKAFGGWYKKTQENDGTKLDEPEWEYITTEIKEGIYKQDIVLSASSPQEAEDELLTYKDEYTIDCKTRNVEFNVDYKIGDIIRLQRDEETITKQVSAVELWLEGSTYHEEPLLTDFKEV